MDKKIKDLIEVSGFYGQKKDYVIAGGGNTSWKNQHHIWIKASGVPLDSIDENGFCVLDRNRLNEISTRVFSDNALQREEEVKNALLNSRLNPGSGLRPSVETSLHNLFSYQYVVHTHPALINGLMCSIQAEEKTHQIFGEKVLFVPYCDPGYILFKDISEKIKVYNNKFHNDPKIVFIQNHGIFVAADSVDEIKDIYAEIESRLKSSVVEHQEKGELQVSEKFVKVLPAIRMMLSEQKLKVASVFNNSWVNDFIADKNAYEKGISKPFTPDQIVYCLSEYLFIEDKSNVEDLIQEVRVKIDDFRKRKAAMPRVLFFRNMGVVVVEDSAVAVGYLKDIVNDFCKVSKLSQYFGGPNPLTPDQISFIESWEVENYRKNISLGKQPEKRLGNKTVVITGAAQGFGAGIAQILFEEGANIIVADLNAEKGNEFTDQLNASLSANKAHFVQVNVADAQSVEGMVRQTVHRYGGIDVLISNAGILRAGSLDEMDPATFELMTKVNYTGYFLCTKYVQAIMKIQHQFKPDIYMDIIQINSKSGLKGSNKNFAYSGGKFGGIGLTQSFALELIPYKIKVNSVCPGNFFDGPLWSDPENGLFVQYLSGGKVSGAKTIADVKAFYEGQVPAGRGCTTEDVARAIFYVIDQQYETGQAVPVTGGQNMLS